MRGGFVYFWLRLLLSSSSSGGGGASVCECVCDILMVVVVVIRLDGIEGRRSVQRKFFFKKQFEK